MKAEPKKWKKSACAAKIGIAQEHCRDAGMEACRAGIKTGTAAPVCW
jgi:hypothetical protein